MVNKESYTVTQLPFASQFFLALLGKDTFKVRISSLDKREHIRIHVPPPLDRQDGTFLVRYRLYGTVQKGLKVEVHHQDAAVAKSPYSVQGLSVT